MTRGNYYFFDFWFFCATPCMTLPIHGSGRVRRVKGWVIQGGGVKYLRKKSVFAVSPNMRPVWSLSPPQMDIPYECELTFYQAHVGSAQMISHAANTCMCSRVIHVSSLASRVDSWSRYSESKFRGVFFLNKDPEGHIWCATENTKRLKKSLRVRMGGVFKSWSLHHHHGW